MISCAPSVRRLCRSAGSGYRSSSTQHGAFAVIFEKIINRANADWLRTRLASAIAPPTQPLDRRAFFAGRQGNRYWWHRTTGNTYVPDIYAMLTDDEFRLLCEWFD